MLSTPVSDRKYYTAGQVGTPGAGPFMTMVLTISDETVVEARFNTYPCPAASACGNFVASWIEGKPLSAIPTITEEMVISGAGQMPLGREHCPKLAVGALKDALVRLERSNSESGEGTAN